MPARMVFSHMSLRRMSTVRRKSFDDLAELSVVEGSKNPSEYPFGKGIVDVRHIPIRMLVEDDIACDYLLFFSRKELSSEPVEFLASHRDIERERNAMTLAPDELHVRQLVKELIETHVSENASMQVTLPSGAASGLRKWLAEFDAADPQARATLALPSEDLQAAIHQCLTDVKNDMLPRFYQSALAEELSRVHLAALISTDDGRAAFGALSLSSLERDAFDFWTAAHAFATATADERPAKSAAVIEKFAPKLPMLDVPVSEIERIERHAKEATPVPGLFLAAQAIALNKLATHYHTLLGEDSGRALLKKLGVAKERQFDKSAMPAAPSLSTGNYADMW